MMYIWKKYTFTSCVDFLDVSMRQNWFSFWVFTSSTKLLFCFLAFKNISESMTLEFLSSIHHGSHLQRIDQQSHGLRSFYTILQYWVWILGLATSGIREREVLINETDSYAVSLHSEEPPVQVGEPATSSVYQIQFLGSGTSGWWLP